MYSLEESAGLGNDSPLRGHLATADEYLKNHESWYVVHQKIPMCTLITGLFYHVGHPAKYPEVKIEDLTKFKDWLNVEGEYVLAGLVDYLKVRLSAKAIRLVMMWIAVNLDLMKERDESKYRSIDAGNVW